jgi:uncharacterized membrane protein YbhN (UPF0104 family)
MRARSRLFSKKNLSFFLRWAGTLLALILLLYLLSQQGWGEIFAAFRKVSLWRFLMALGFTFVSRFAVAGRWHVLLRSAGTRIPARHTLQITFAGLFASNFLPTTIGGDVVRLGGAIRLGYDRAISLASLIVDRLIGMTGMGMAALTLIFSLPELFHAIEVGHIDIFHRGGKRSFQVKHLSFWLNTAGVAFIGAVIQRSGWLKKLKLYLEGAFARLFEALKLWLFRPQSLLGALAFTWIHMLCVFGSIWILLPGLGEAMPIWRIAGLWALTYFVTLLPISVNGLGVQELSMTFFFTTFGGITTASGLTMALFMRFLPMFASLPGALFIPGLLVGDEK